MIGWVLPYASESSSLNSFDWLDGTGRGGNVTADVTTRGGREPGRKIFSGQTIDYHGQPVGAILGE